MNSSSTKSEGFLDRYTSLRRLGIGRRARVPFVQQLATTECGLACLAMILGYFGRNVGLDQFREVRVTGRDGLSAQSLLAIGDAMGLRGRGVRVDIGQLAMLAEGATILHWEFKHFVVLERVERDGIRIVDPALGRRKISSEEVGRSFTGVALTFEPNERFKFEKRRLTWIKTMWRFFEESGVLSRLIVMSVILQGFGLTLPLLTGQLIDRVIPRADYSFMFALVVGALLVNVFQAIGSFIRERLLLHLRTVLEVRMSLGFLDHLVSLPYSYFQSRGGGDLLMRLHSNTIVREHLTSAALSGLLDAGFAVTYLLVLVFGDRTMALTAVAIALVNVPVYVAVAQRQRELMTMGLEAQAKTRSFEVDLVTSIETLKASGTEHRAVAHWTNLMVESTNLSLQRDRLMVNTATVLKTLKTSGPLVMVIVGATQVMAGDISLGTMLSLNAVAANFLSPLSTLVDSFLGLEIVRAYLERVNDVLETEPEQQSDMPAAPQLTGEFAFEQVSFRYPGQSNDVISDFSVGVGPGQFVAIVGRSGSGKSTLVNLLLGLRVPQSGRVTMNGVDISKLDLRSVRRQVGVVNQRLGVFGHSIRENITLGDHTLEFKDVVRAAELACVHDEIQEMPLNYETPLVDQGASISGGQRQRIAIARALVRRPSILVLDEATSALDAVTEAKVQRALERLKCTRLVVAHRLSTVMRADLILVMDGGRVAESGTHHQLMTRRGLYHDLVNAQLVNDLKPGSPPMPQTSESRTSAPVIDSPPRVT